MKTIRINVTERDIARGRPRNLQSCPIARAAHRHQGLRRAEVNGASIVVPLAGTTSSYYIAMPQRAQSFVGAFDAGLHPEPFSFNITVNEDFIHG